MKKIFGIILVIALIFAIPPARERVGSAAVPLLEKMGPVGAALLNPARRMGAKGRTDSMMSLLLNELQEGREAPNERGFAAWMLRRGADETGIDPWGTPYWMARERGAYIIGSSGPDRQRGTDDDITARSDD